MLRQELFSKCIRSVNNLIVRRKKSVVIRQIETTKLTKAQHMKKVNYETSFLYGSKRKIPEEAIVVEEVDKDVKGVDSEIYWTMPNDAKKQSKADEISENDVRKDKKQRAKKNSETSAKNKLKLTAEEKLPKTFAKFKLDLPKPVKVTIHDVFKSIDTQMNQDDQHVTKQKEIPFNDNQIRNLLNFPLVIENSNLTFSMFSETPMKSIGFTPSVSKILQATMSPSQKQALLQWKNLKIAELGLQGFEDMQKLYLTRGKRFHECLQRYFSEEKISDEDLTMDIVEVWHSISDVLKDFQVPATLTEHHLNHPYLFYKGIVDCVAVHRQTNTLSVIEWKNSDRYKKTVSSTYDAPLQLCAYMSALNATEFISKPLTNGIIVVAYNDGQKADLIELSSNDIKKYYQVWLTRLQDYWIRYRDNTLNLDVI